MGGGRRRLASISGGGVNSAQVADAWEAMAADGVLAPADRPLLDEARKRAGR